MKAHSIADSYIEVAGDFGNLKMGQTDDALDRMDGVLGSNMDIDGTTVGDAYATSIGGDVMAVSYIAPSVGGFTPYVSIQADGAGTGYGFNFQAGPATVMFQALDATADSSVIGVGFSAGAVTVGAGAKRSKTAGVTTTTNDVGVSYTAGDVKLIATHRKQGSGKFNTVGAKYTIAPGLTAAIENGSVTGTSPVDSTYASLTVAF